MTPAVLALGANLGDPAAALQGAVHELAKHPDVTIRAVSPCYRTAPVGGPAQPDFLNAVVLIDTNLTPQQLLSETMNIEATWHRERLEHWGPRTLDIDIIAIGEFVSDDPMLTLPHPRAHERAFVLIPWAEVDPDGQLVGRGSVRDLLDFVDQHGVVRSDVVLSTP